jgi:hypothetical protein
MIPKLAAFLVLVMVAALADRLHKFDFTLDAGAAARRNRYIIGCGVSRRMSDKSYKLEWKLEIKDELEDAGLSYSLIALLVGQSSQPPIKGTWLTESMQPHKKGIWLSAIPLEYIRDPYYRFTFWGLADDVLDKLTMAPKDREVLATKLARVVEPLTETESQVAAERDREYTELRDAFLREIELQRQFSAQPTPELEAQLREARNNTNQIELKINEKIKKRYQEETQGI